MLDNILFYVVAVIFFVLFCYGIYRLRRDKMMWFCLALPFALALIQLILIKTAQAEDAPKMPELKQQEYFSQETREKNRQIIDQAMSAMPSAPRVPNITVPSQPDIDIGKIANQYKAKLNQKKQTEQIELLVFVSNSMPAQGLKKLALEAKRANATLVFRGISGGMGKGAWLKSMETLKPIAETGVSLMIHPEYFKQYEVSAVPTFVLAKRETATCQSGQCNPHLKANGDVSLSYVLEHWADQSSELANIAKARLAVLQGGQ